MGTTGYCVVQAALGGTGGVLRVLRGTRVQWGIRGYWGQLMDTGATGWYLYVGLQGIKFC